MNQEFGVTIVMVTHDLLAARRADRRIRRPRRAVAARGNAGRAARDDGRLRLPDEAVAALGGAELEAEVTVARSDCGGGARPGHA